MRLSALLVLALLGLGSAAAPAASPEDDYRAADKRLSDEFDGMDYEAEAPSPVLAAYWQAVDAVLAARGVDGFAALAKGDQFVEVKALALGDGIQLIAVNREQLGHLAVLDHGRIGWTSPSDTTAPACWRGGEGPPCSTERIEPLAADSGGAPRFYIQAGYAQLAGGTRGHQLSLWRWADGKADAFYTADFATGGDVERQGVTLAGDELDILGKSFWANFSVCGACAGRQMHQRLRLTPTGVTNLGTDSLHPELDVIDDLLGRLADDRPTDEIATPEAAAMVKKSWHGSIFAMDPVVADHVACIAPDDNPALLFRFAGGPKAMKITAIEPGRCS